MIQADERKALPAIPVLREERWSTTKTLVVGGPPFLESSTITGGQSPEQPTRPTKRHHTHVFYFSVYNHCQTDSNCGHCCRTGPVCLEVLPSSLQHCSNARGQLMMPISGILANSSSPLTSNLFVFFSSVCSAICRALKMRQPGWQMIHVGWRLECHLQLCEGLTDTAMSPPAKAHVHGNVWPIQNKLVRVVENGRISVGSAVGDRDGNARLDCLSVHHDLLGDRSREASVWAEQPHKLFDGCRYQTWVLPQLLLKFLVLG